MTYETLEQSLNTKKCVVVGIEDYDHKGNCRKWIKVRKARGKKVFRVVQYENGRYSEAV